MGFAVIILIMACLSETVFSATITIQRTGPQARQKPLQRAPQAKNGNNNQPIKQNNPPFNGGSGPSPVIYPAPFTTGSAQQIVPPGYFVQAPASYPAAVPFNQPFYQAAQAPTIPFVQRPFSFPGDPCSPVGRPSCIASSICSARGACECPHGFARSRFFCTDQQPAYPGAYPVPIPAPAPAPYPQPVYPFPSPIAQYPLPPFDAPVPIAPSVPFMPAAPLLPRYFQVAPAPAPAPIAPSPFGPFNAAPLAPPPVGPGPFSMEMPFVPPPPPVPTSLRWALVGIIPVKERPIFDLPMPAGPFSPFLSAPAPSLTPFMPSPVSIIPAGFREAFKPIPASTVPALIPFSLFQRPMAPLPPPAELLNPMPYGPAPTPMYQPAPLPYASPAAAPWGGFSYPNNPFSSPFNAPAPMEGPSPFSPVNSYGPAPSPMNSYGPPPPPPNPYAAPSYMVNNNNPGVNFAPIGAQPASPLDGAADEKKSNNFANYGDANSYASTESASYIAAPVADSLGMLI